MASEAPSTPRHVDLSLAPVLPLLTTILGFAAPLYVLGDWDVERLYRRVYYVSADTAWQATSLTDRTTLIREALQLLGPPALAALASLVVIAVIGTCLAYLWEWRSRRQRELAPVTPGRFLARAAGKGPYPHYPIWFYVGMTAIVLLLMCVYYEAWYQTQGMFTTSATLQPSRRVIKLAAYGLLDTVPAAWWPLVCGIVAGAGVAVLLYGLGRNVRTIPWALWALFLTYLPALLTGYWASYRLDSTLLHNPSPLAPVVLCPAKAPSGHVAALTPIVGDLVAQTSDVRYLFTWDPETYQLSGHLVQIPIKGYDLVAWPSVSDLRQHHFASRVCGSP